ncbi:MAG: fatty acid desaturase family protein [Pseudomonadota bacterium]
MAVAPRIDPKSLFSAEEWASLSNRSNWKGLALIAHAWLVILAAGAVAVIWPITIPLAVMIIGGRQLGLAVLMHDGAHGALHRNLKLNDWAGEWLTTGGLSRYRPYHLTHHKYVQQAEDPDLVLSAPFPITPLSLRRKIVRDLTGQTWFKQRFGLLRDQLAARKPGEPLTPILMAELKRKRRFLIGAAVTIAVTAPFGLWWVWFVLWLLPQATWQQMITRLRNIAEHACVAKDERDPFRCARTTYAGPVERAFIAPYWVNYHCEHHIFMHLPCYNLPRAHRLLLDKGLGPQMEIRRSYLEVLRLAASKGRPPSLAPA